MKILFISPSTRLINYDKNYFSLTYHLLGNVFYSSSLNFRMLTAVTPRKYDIKLIDEEYQKINYDEENDIVGIATTTPTAYRAYEIADEFRRRGITVVLGGCHSSALPEEAKQHADAVVIGEAELTWPQLLNDFQDGKLKPFYQNENPIDLKNIPSPDRKRLTNKQGFITEGIQATRGCSVGCSYCSLTNSSHGQIFRFRPVDHVIEEIKSIRQKILFFSDSSLTMNPSYTKELFKAMKNLNKKFSCSGNVNILNRDDELLKLASEAGCFAWGTGFESISQESIDFIGKKSNRVNEYESAVKKIHDFGMAVCGHFVFGLDGDHIDIFDKTLNAIHNWDLDLAQFHICTPFPGTPLFNFLENEKRILTKDWLKYDTHHVVFRPKHMTPQELLDGMNKAYNDFYSSYNVVKRVRNYLMYGLYPFLILGSDNLFIKSDLKYLLKQKLINSSPDFK